MNKASETPARLAETSLLQRYEPMSGAYDEMFAHTSMVREPWREFVELLDALGPQELRRRWQQARRMIHENGVTYNVHGDPQGRDRQWELDALPLVMRAGEWLHVAGGLAQRARLLNALLADLYGPQQLMREGLLPAELVFGHPNFLRACHGWSVPTDCRLHLHAAHLARSPEGNWSVVADRTQAPAGAGYAVENRIVISRMIPHVYHHCRVQRLAGFFMALRETLAGLSTRRSDQPNIVLLSPGPTSPTYFEDSYLSRYLGYTLVEGEDLTVRDNRVYLKTLSGLESVDVILRRVRDEHCDPLELDGQSRLGVPGLVHAARRGNVVLANSLGSGLLEAPALLAFLPAICRRLLNEDLLLPSVATWWCGDASSLSFVLANLGQLVIRTVNPSPVARPIHGGTLARAQLAELAARIKARPKDFVAQEFAVRSTAPVWGDGEPRRGHILLRTFSVAAGDSYQAMPGGLAHVTASMETIGQSMFFGNGSKDVWVLSSAPVAPVTLLPPPGTPVELRRSGHDLPSRVADSLFWLGRHVERSEGCVRLLRSIVTRLVSESATGNASELPVLYAALMGELPAETGRPPGTEFARESDLEIQVLAFLYDQANPRSLQSMLTALDRSAAVVRDRISIDTWRILKRIDDDFHPGYPLGVISLADVLTMLNQMILTFAAFNGVAMENMTRGPGWQFLELGRRIERALTMIGLLRSTLYLAEINEHAVLEALLEIADSSMTYRNRYATNLQVAPVLDLLMTDETNPRSIAYQLAALARHVERMPQQEHAMLTSEQRLVLAVLSNFRLTDTQALAETDDTGARPRLEEMLVDAVAQLSSLANSISNKYLVHAGPAHQLAEIHRG